MILITTNKDMAYDLTRPGVMWGLYNTEEGKWICLNKNGRIFYPTKKQADHALNKRLYNMEVSTDNAFGGVINNWTEDKEARIQRSLTETNILLSNVVVAEWNGGR